MLISLPGRILGTIRLDPSTIEKIERDRTALVQAIALVFVVSVIAGIEARETLGLLPGVALGVVLGFAGWLAFSAAAYFIGAGVLPGEATEAEAELKGVLRTVGFAQAPNLLAIFSIVPGGFTGTFLSFAGAVWVVVCEIVAIRVALRVSTARAIAIGLIATVLISLPLAMILLVV